MSTRSRHDVALALVERDGLWLVAQRHNHAHLGGLWEFPGGKRRAHESARAAALRELLEECGVIAEARGVLATLTCEYADRVVQLTPVLCRWTSGEARPLASRACRWVTADELRRLAMPAVNAKIIRAALAST